MNAHATANAFLTHSQPVVIAAVKDAQMALPVSVEVKNHVRPATRPTMAPAMSPNTLARIAMFRPWMPLVDSSVMMFMTRCAAVKASNPARAIAIPAAIDPTAIASAVSTSLLRPTQSAISRSAGSALSFSHVIESPIAPNTRSATGASSTASICLNSCHCSAASAVSSATPRIVSDDAPVAAAKSSTDNWPDFTASTNWPAPRVPKILPAKSRAATSLPTAVKFSISVIVSNSAFFGSRPSFANATIARDMPAIVLSASRPALSSEPMRAAESPISKPNCRNCGPPLTAESASSVMDKPVACEI